jgi:uncharacterized membrane protein HdeD (DUF308 family)
MLQKIEMVRETVQHLYITLALMGILFVSLGVLVFIYPYALAVLATVTFILVGILLLVAAGKVYSLWQKLPSFIKGK